MNKIKTFLNCVTVQIKKKFFNMKKSDISHACEKLNEMVDEVTSIEELKHTEEYAYKYNATTRWQTL